MLYDWVKIPSKHRKYVAEIIRLGLIQYRKDLPEEVKMNLEHWCHILESPDPLASHYGELV